MQSDRHRILVTSHAHPDFSFGGGELAAYNLYRSYKDHPSVEDAFFLARHDGGKGPTGAIQMRRKNEFLWEQGIRDWFPMKSANPLALDKYFGALLRQIRPTIVHIHHYLHVGLEYIYIIKKIDPSIRIVLTLHEYVPICFNQGHMIKPGSNRLCYRESPEDCRGCYPEFSAEDFWLRKHRYMAFFKMVDQFVTPSDFLRERYIQWGIAPDRIVTIENGQQDPRPLPPRRLAEGETRNRFAFFGQITPFKGVQVLLEALTSMRKAERRSLTLAMNCANFEGQAPEFRQTISDLLEPLKNGTVQWLGPYEPSQMDSRMVDVDWVVVPSIWWENSPMVIQEAFSFGRPVICSNIGGMAEKVDHGVNGMHVPVGNARAWAQTLLEAAGQTEEWDRLRAGIRMPLTYAACAEAHMALLDKTPVTAE